MNGCNIYISNDDLSFLSKARDEELKDLVNCLIFDKDNEKRYTETLSSSEEYKKYGHEYSRYWLRIVEELELFGGNTLANVFRLGKGVSYKEIVQDVAKELKIKFNSSDTAEEIENKLILKVFEDTWKNFSLEDKKKFISEMGFSDKDLTAQGVTAAVQFCLKMGGFNTYKLTVIVVNAVSRAILGRGLTFAANATVTKGLSLFIGPIGWAFTGVWTLIDIASPAKRVTIPAVFYIALLRKQIRFRMEILECEPTPVILSSGEKILNNKIIAKQFDILGLDYLSLNFEVIVKYETLLENYKELKEKQEISEELYNYKIKDLERAYQIINNYHKNIYTQFDPEKVLINCPECSKKLRLNIKNEKHKCPNCSRILTIKN